MQDINLLQNKLKDRSTSWQRKNSAVTAVFVILAVLVVGAGGYLYWSNNQLEQDTVDLLAENTAIQSELASMQGNLADAKALQAQFLNIDRLLQNHIYWGQVLDVVEDTVLVRSQYLSMSASSDGRVHLEGLLDNLNDLGKLILSLSTNDNFGKVELGSAALNSGQRAGYLYSLDFVASPNLLTNE